jgi:diguanylate cyclase (GGDEF)-like protein
VVVLLACAWLAVMGGSAEYLSRSQASARRVVSQRLAARAQMGAEFSGLYVQSIFGREQAQARRWLSSPTATMQGLRNASSAMGVPAAVLLDSTGHVLQVLPAKPALLGQVITGKYAHLAAAVAGRTAVSNVVLSAARGLPVVAFAIPFTTPVGRRVFSGAFQVAKTPLGEYMSHLLVTPGHRVYLIDARDNLIAASTRFASGEKLGQADPGLAARAQTRTAGSYSTAHGVQWFETAKIADTPWRIVISVPAAALFANVDAGEWLAWIALIGLTVAGLIIIAIGLRLARSRERLANVNRELDRLARVDALTGLRNRRDIEEKLIAAVSAAERHGSSLAVLVIDIDHFKRINDTYGHQAGDVALCTVAQTIHDSLRVEDTVGRWGGEEFLAVLTDTDAQGALVVAERLRAAIAENTPQTDSDHPMTVTVGVADWQSGGIDDLIKRADAALYAGKANGRNTVELNPAISTEYV